MTKERPRPRRRRKWWIAIAAVVIYTVAGFLVAPPVLKAQIEKRGSLALGRQVTVGPVRVNPYALSVTLEKLDVRLKDGGGSFLGWDRLHVNFEALASIGGEWVLGAVELDGFHITALLKRDGAFNFDDIIERLAAAAKDEPAAPEKPGRPLRIDSLKVHNARLDFADESRTRPFATTLGPVTFAVTEFRTAGSRGAPYHFTAVTETGERLDWTGTLSAAPFVSIGEILVEKLHLPKYAAYYADATNTEVAGGWLTVRGRYELRLGDGARVAKLTNGTIEVRDLKLLERATNAPAFELASLDVAGIAADAVALKLEVATVALSGGSIHGRRDADGTVNLLKMLQPTEAPTAAAKPAPAGPAASPAAPRPLAVSVGELAFQDFTVAWSDGAAPRPAQLGLTALQGTIRSFSLADGARMPVSLSFGWQPAGTVSVDGTVAIKPTLAAELKTEVAGLQVLPASPYLEQFLNARLTQGAVTLGGTMRVDDAEAGPAIAFDGRVAVEKLGLVDGAQNEELAGFASLALEGLKIGTAPEMKVQIAEVNLAAPYARVTVNADKKLNLATLARTGAEEPPAAADDKPAAAGPPPVIAIAKVSIADGELRFTDRSVEPAVQTGVTQLGGTIAGLSSANLGRGEVDLKATVGGTGPIVITGKLDPLGAKKAVDLKIDFRNVDLLPLGPYSARFAGYELARGKLTLDVAFKLDDRKVDAANVITLNQFTFGAPVASPQATKLPVRLAVALLKDMEGKIVIDVPVAGNLDDPQFGVGRVVLRVIVNLLTKAAVSPFALLGSMFGGGGDELAFQEFAPGSSELQAAEIQKLETMVKALTNRPGLSVALEAGYDGPADSHALRQTKLAALLRSRIWEERRALDPNVPPPAGLTIEPAEEAAMVKKVFDEKFPPGTEFGAPVAAAPVVASAPAAPKKGIVARVVDALTFRRSRADRPSAPEATAPEAGSATESAPAGPSAEEMKARLAATMTVDEADLRALATARAERVRDYFLNEGKIAAERLFLARGEAKAGENRGPRVFLGLQ